MTRTSIVQPRLLSRLNERLVLNAIQTNGPSTRAELTDEIGVTFATVAKAVSSLIDAHLLEEFDEPTTGRGRPAKRLRLAINQSQVVGVAIEVDEILVVTAALDGAPHGAPQALPTPRTYAKLLSAVKGAVEKLCADGSPKTLGVGVSVAAQVDENAGRVAVAANLPYLTGKPLEADLTEALDLPCSIVRDTHAVCVSERLRGAARSLDNFLLLHLGVGIGMGVMINGRIFFGHHGYSGELGHMTAVPDGEICHCGRHGCLETVASEWALINRLTERLGRRVTLDDIARLYMSGDPTTQQEVHQACKGLALGVSHAVHLFNPGKVVVYSRLFDACPELLPVLVERIEESVLPLNFQGCDFVNATTTPIDGSVAHAINCLSESLAPRLSRQAISQVN